MVLLFIRNKNGELPNSYYTTFSFVLFHFVFFLSFFFFWFLCALWLSFTYDMHEYKQQFALSLSHISKLKLIKLVSHCIWHELSHNHFMIVCVHTYIYMYRENRKISKKLCIWNCNRNMNRTFVCTIAYIVSSNW